MLRFALPALLVTALACGTASAQTTKKPMPPARKAPATSAAKPAPQPKPAASTKSSSQDDGQGEYVAPGMTGAPDDKVTTDYNNRPLRKPAANTSTMSSQPQPQPKPAKKTPPQ